eukprot:85996-Amphidinium_carterae.1
MSCDAGELDYMQKELAALEKKLAAQAGRKPNKGACKRAYKEGGKGCFACVRSLLAPSESKTSH